MLRLLCQFVDMGLVRFSHPTGNIFPISRQHVAFSQARNEKNHSMLTNKFAYNSSEP